MRPRTGSSAPPPRAASGRSNRLARAAGVLRGHVDRSRPRPASSPVERAIAGGARQCEVARASAVRTRRSSQLGAHRIADVELRRVQRHRHAKRLQPIDDVAAGRLFVGGARLADQRRRSAPAAPAARRAGWRRVRVGLERLVLEHVDHSGHRRSPPLRTSDPVEASDPTRDPKTSSPYRASSKNIARFAAGVGGVSRLTTTKVSALATTPTSTESMP